MLVTTSDADYCDLFNEDCFYLFIYFIIYGLLKTPTESFRKRGFIYRL